MSKLRSFIYFFTAILLQMAVFRFANAQQGIHVDLSASLSALVEEELANQRFPAAELIVLHDGKEVFHRSFGSAKPNSIWDLASLTKFIATAPSVLLLAQQKKISLDDPINKFLPDYKPFRNSNLRIRNLLLHNSGLPSVVWAGPKMDQPHLCDERSVLFDRLRQANLKSAPGSNYQYSDLGYLTLGAIVEKVSGKSLAQFTQSEIFTPLGMNDTRFQPALDAASRIISPWPGGGNTAVVYDPLAARCEGIAGHAGLFSTAKDLALFAQALISADSPTKNSTFNSALKLQAFTDANPTDAQRESIRRTLIGRLVTETAIGHTGFTGTSIVIDPIEKISIIFLSNRTYREPPPSINDLRRRIQQTVYAALSRYRPGDKNHMQVPIKSGLDQLIESKFAGLEGRHIGLVTNSSAITLQGETAVQIFSQTEKVNLVAIFSPEHGIDANLDRHIVDGKIATKQKSIPVYSLFGENRRPTPEMLQGIDTLVFDLQDVGTRFYTYLATMGWAMEEAAKRKIKFVVLDRPNPLGIETIEGPLSSSTRLTSTNYYPLPIRYGLTIGELAKLYNSEKKINADLQVIPLSGLQTRDTYFPETLRPWANPSPNIRSWLQSLVYGATGLLEGTNLAVGRGTDTPFLVVGAPWINAKTFAAALNQQHLPGIYFTPITFTPTSSRYQGKACNGVRLIVLDRRAFQPAHTSITIANILRKIYVASWDTRDLYKLMGDGAVSKFADEKFNQLRKKFFLYEILKD